MQKRDIYGTRFDFDRLSKLIEGTQLWSSKDREYLGQLEEELDRAHVVAPEEIPPDVITMNSTARVTFLQSGKTMDLVLVFPPDADIEKGKISILAPLGIALLGYRVGDTIEWEVPAGLRKLKVQQILYQPEAAGHYYL